MTDDYEPGVPLEMKFSELVEAARQGDALAARDVLSQVSGWVTHARMHNELVPALVLEYLDLALRRMTYGDRQADGTCKPVSGDDAFYLKAKGKRHWTIAAKKLAAEQVHQILYMGYETSVEAAAANAAHIIPQIVASIRADLETRALENIAQNDLQITPAIKTQVVAMRIRASLWHPFFDRTPNEEDLKRWHAQFYGRRNKA